MCWVEIKKRLISKRGDNVSNGTLVNESIKEANDRKLKEIFYLACKYDDSDTIKRYIDMQLINPCENGYLLLKYAIERKCLRIVEVILNSNLFINLPRDTKAAIRFASTIGDSSFALHMLT